MSEDFLRQLPKEPSHMESPERPARSYPNSFDDMLHIAPCIQNATRAMGRNLSASSVHVRGHGLCLQPKARSSMDIVSASPYTG